MKIPTTILAVLLGATPIAALAHDNDHQSSAPASRAESHYSQPQARYSQPQAHYSQSRYAPQARYTQQQPRYVQQPSERYTRPAQPMPRYVARPGAGYRVAYTGYRGPAWGWNRGVAWAPAYGYWGGGFWGNFAIGLSFGSAGYYNVQTDSPGAQLLANYGLTQGPCDQDNMVQIYGPDNSEICAYPNNTVSPGQYQIDMSNLSLVSF